MKVFVTLSVVLALATAKPQGYAYNQPFGGSGSLSGSSSNTFSSNSFGALDGGSQSFVSGPSFAPQGPSFAPAPQGPSFAPAPQGPSFAPAPQGPSFAPALQGPSFGPAPQGPSFAPAPLPLGSASPGFGNGVTLGGSLNSLNSGSVFGGASQSYSQGQSFSSFAPAATIQKHIYVHVPPVDHEEIAQQQQLAPVINRQKHYKIIFIKAPETQSISHQLVQQQQQINEEKTLVYVLVKKPESLSEIQSQVQQTVIPPSKPEVYFIKYKAQKEQFQGPAPQQIALPSPQPISVSTNVAQETFSVPSLPVPQAPSPVYGPGH